MTEKIRCQGPNCFRTFPPDRNKMYCSPACRMRASRISRAEIDIELSRLKVHEGQWSGQQGSLADPTYDRPRMAIVQNCPEGSAGYRLGTFAQIIKGPPLLRLFPTYATTPLGVFSMEPYEHPYVPFSFHMVTCPARRLRSVSRTEVGLARRG